MAAKSFFLCAALLFVDSAIHAQAGGDHPTPPLADAAPITYQPLTGMERWKLYWHDAFWNPGVFFSAAGPALGGQLNNDPAPWGQGMEGYSKRFANYFGRFALQGTYEAAGAALLQHDLRYFRSKRSGFLPRAAHALSANFVTYERNGRPTPNFARVGSIVGAEFTGNLWMPDGYRNASKAMRGAGMELGARSAVDLIREFAPELKRIFGRRQASERRPPRRKLPALSNAVRQTALDAGGAPGVESAMTHVGTTHTALSGSRDGDGKTCCAGPDAPPTRTAG